MFTYPASKTTGWGGRLSKIFVLWSVMWSILETTAYFMGSCLCLFFNSYEKSKDFMYIFFLQITN